MSKCAQTCILADTPRELSVGSVTVRRANREFLETMTKTAISTNSSNIAKHLSLIPLETTAGPNLGHAWLEAR